MTKIYMPPGANVDEVSTTQEFELGARAVGADGSKWIYGKADEAISQYMAVALVKDFGASKLTKTLADAGSKIAVAQVAFSANEYGWFLYDGGGNDNYKVMAKNSCAINVGLYTTASAGMLDDTAASQTAILGIKLTDTSTSSGATEECFIFAELRAAATP